MLKDFFLLENCHFGEENKKIKTVQVHQVTGNFTHLWHALFILKKQCVKQIFQLDK